MQDLITGLALAFSLVSFVVFIVLLWRQTQSGNPAGDAAKSIVARAAPADDLAKLMEALGKLVETLKTASPALLAFAASVLFLLVAVLENAITLATGH